MNSPLPSPDPRPGDRLGAWRITGVLGRGGMALVYAVVHEETGEERALKLLLAQVASEEVRSRFDREFRALSHLDHPHVTRVFEAGVHGDRPFYVMEHLAGHDLRQEMEAWTDLPAEERFRRSEDVLVQVAGALAHIHSRGLVHRDISPSNIMVLRGGGVKLMDFGVVKEPGTDLTTAGELVGTVAYIAPEQFTGDRVDERADLYSLGAVLYVMLTGRRPFHARTVAGYLEKHLHRPPRPPRELAPGIPVPLDEACLRLLAKDPADRFASANHLLHFLRSGGPASLEVRGARWPHRTVGRAAEMAFLREAISALEAGRGGVVLLEGASGTGKTRLLEDLATLARERAHPVLVGVCGKAEGRAFSGFGEIYAGLVAEGMVAPRPLARVFEPDEEGAATQPMERYAIYAAFLDLLRASLPRVVVIENLHRADSGSLALVEYLVRNLLGLSQERILLVLSRWPVLDGPDPMSGVVTGEATGVPVQRLPLGPLPEAAVEDLLLSLVPGDRAAPALARRIHREGEGNAHFIVEMIRGLVEDRAILVDDQGYPALRHDIAEITRSGLPVPQSLRAALRERLAPLSDAARGLAILMAVARQEASLDLLIQVAGGDGETLAGPLDELVEAGVVRCRQVGTEERFDISHSGLRDVLLEDVDPAERRALHRRIGIVYERAWRGRLGPVLEIVAWHFEQGDVPAKAWPYLIRAGEHLLSRSFVPEALAALDRALRLEPVAREFLVLDEADRALVRLLLARSRAFTHLGRWEEADGEAIAAHRIAEDLRDGRLLARTHFELGSMHRRRTDLDVSEHHFQEARRLAEAEGDLPLKVLSMNRLGGIRWARGDLDGAKQAWIQVLALGETAQDRRSMAAGYGGLGLMAICRGQSAEARRYLEQACQEYEKLGAFDTLTVTRVNLVELYHLTGNLRRGLVLADKTVAQAREVRHQEGLALGLRYRALVLVDLGRLAEARAHVEDALRIVRDQGNTEEELGCYASMARIAFYQGAMAEASSWLDQALPLVDRYDIEGVAPLLHAWRARIHAWRGDAEAVHTALAESDRAEGRRWPFHLCRVELSTGRALAAVGRRDEARVRVQAALDRAEGAGYRFYTFKAHKLLADLATEGATAEHHHRVAQAMGRSLAANLATDDAQAFLAFHATERDAP